MSANTQNNRQNKNNPEVIPLPANILEAKDSIRKNSDLQNSLTNQVIDYMWSVITNQNKLITEQQKQVAELVAKASTPKEGGAKVKVDTKKK